MRWALVGLLALVALFAVIRPMIRRCASATPGTAALAGGGAMPALAGGRTVAELEGELQAAAGRQTPRASSLKSIADKAEHEPEHVAKLVRAMLAQEDR